MRAAAPLVFLVALLAASCRTGAGAPTIVVFASASLGAVADELARAFEDETEGARVQVNSAGTARLLVQLREGARADVLVSADEASAREALALVGSSDPPRPLATNHLVLCVPRGNPRSIAGLADLARADLTVALCAPEVPAGRYARALLGARGVEVRSVSDEPSVRALVAKVALGELDAAIVYATDMRDSGVEALALEDAATRCWTAVLGDGARRPDAERFATFLQSDRAHGVLAERGFTAP